MNGESRFCFDIKVPFLVGDRVKLKDEARHTPMSKKLETDADMKFEGIQKVEQNASILGVFLENGYLYKYSMLEKVN